MPKSNEREYRAMACMASVKRSAEETEPTYVVEGYATTFDDPYILFDDIKEQISRHAFDGCDMSDVIFQYDHTGMVFARTRNGSLLLKCDEHGLYIRADLSLTAEARSLWEAIDKGLIDRMSFCFTVEEDIFDKETKTDTITKIGKLYDVSAVSIPANPGTDISTARKAMLDGEIERARTERSEKARREKNERIRRMKLRIRVEELRNEF